MDTPSQVFFTKTTSKGIHAWISCATFLPRIRAMSHAFQVNIIAIIGDIILTPKDSCFLSPYWRHYNRRALLKICSPRRKTHSISFPIQHLCLHFLNHSLVSIRVFAIIDIVINCMPWHIIVFWHNRAGIFILNNTYWSNIEYHQSSAPGSFAGKGPNIIMDSFINDIGLNHPLL